jgi:hypothetical protein
MKVVVWNMEQDHGNWQVLKHHDADIALLCEAPPPPPANIESIGHWRTRGLDCPHPDERSCTCRPWSTAIVSPHPLEKIEDARISRGGRKLFYGPSRPGSWIAGVVKKLPGFGTVTAISLYGLLDEKSDASVHRSLSELAPVLDRRRYSRLLLLGGDLNTLAIEAGTARLAKDLGVLERITEGFGLVDLLQRDLLRRTPPRGLLAGCPCSFGEGCTHTWTHRRRDSDIPYQDDYLFASPALVERLERCEALAFDEESSSDHAPIVATFS